MNTYQKIELSEYTRSGEGGTAVSYTHKSRNTLAKLYNPGFEADRTKAEFYTARKVFEMGIPTPETLRLVTDGERYGPESFIPRRSQPGNCVPTRKSLPASTRKRNWSRKSSSRGPWSFWKRFRIPIPAFTVQLRNPGMGSQHYVDYRQQNE